MLERQARAQREREQELKADVDEEKRGYLQLKEKLMDRVQRMEQEIIDLKDVIESKERELRRDKRESEK
jgi:hypothetical protein